MVLHQNRLRISFKNEKMMITRSMGYRGYGTHSQWRTGVWGIWAMGYRSMGHMGNEVQGCGAHGQWGTGVWGTCMGNAVQGMGHRGMGYRSMRHMGNGVKGVWGTWAMGYRGMGCRGMGYMYGQ